MAGQNIIDGDLIIRGSLSLTSGGILNAPSSSIPGTALNASTLVPANRMQHAHRAVYAQGSASNVAAATQVIHVVVGATGTIQAVKAGSVVVAVGAATATVDVKKNGTSILTGVITLSSSNVARVAVSGTIAVATVVAGDVLEIVVTATAGGGTLAQGLFAVVDIFEDPSWMSESPGISTAFNAQQIADLQALLSPEQIPKAQVSAINKTLTKVKTQVKRAVKAELNLKRDGLDNKLLRVVNANRNTLAGAIRVSRKGIPLIEYGAKQTRNGITVAREIHHNVKGITSAHARKSVKGGVTVKVRKSGGTENHPHYFITQLRNGHIGVFDRKKAGAKRVGRNPIQQKYGPTAVGVLAGSPGILPSLQKFAADDLTKQVASQISRFTKSPTSDT